MHFILLSGAGGTDNMQAQEAYDGSEQRLGGAGIFPIRTIGGQVTNPEDECRQSELHARLKQFVGQLSPPLRQAFELRELDGLTISEAAQILGVPDGTVKAQLARARMTLTRRMRRELNRQPRSAIDCSPLPVGARK